MTATTDVRAPDAAAVRASIDIVSGVTPADLDRATPCAGWALRALLAHMTVQHLGFAAAARGTTTDLEAWVPDLHEADPVGAYSAAAEQVLVAFAGDDVLGREFALPEISTTTTIPAAVAIGFHLVDYVVHGWDVARALGRPYELERAVTDAALPIAEQVPDGPRRLVPGAAFRPALPASEDEEALDRIVALLGRSPRWPDA